MHRTFDDINFALNCPIDENICPYDDIAERHVFRFLTDRNINIYDNYYFPDSGDYINHGNVRKYQLISYYNVQSKCNNRIMRRDYLSENKTKVNKWMKSTDKYNYDSKNLKFKSLSCLDLRVHFNDILHQKPCLSVITNVDQSLLIPAFLSTRSYQIARSFRGITEHTRMNNYVAGEIDISKVLFSTHTGTLFVIPDEYSIYNNLCFFSYKFQQWLSNKNVIFKPRDLKSWNHRNVIVGIPEFRNDATYYRRARHILSNSTDHFFVELDTGMVRAIPHHYLFHVVQMPLKFSYWPPAILECQLTNIANPSDIAEKVSHIRRNRRAYITSFDHYCHEQYFGKEMLVPKITTVKDYKVPNLSTLFCEDENCQMLCCITSRVEPEISA